MILVGTSVWVDHLRKGVATLSASLEHGMVLRHPFVLGELACGNLANRREVLARLGDLPLAPLATDEEARAFVERRTLMGRGIGYIDVHLLASVALDRGAKLWTRDGRLAAVSVAFGFAHAEPRD